tara:strand:+ start:220 stop:1062 length:843 start_codon:yes stop_codon:yes gene_type:complete
MKEKSALVVEGGGFKAAFTAGILDTFISYDYDPFDIYVGVSSGAMNLSSFVSKQYKRNIKIIKDIASNSNFLSIFRYLKGGNYMDLDLLIEEGNKRNPLKVRKAIENIKDKKLAIVATDIENGEPVYLEPNTRNWKKYLKASSSLPLITSEYCEIDSKKLLDGGMSDPIPAKQAYRMGANKITVLRTHPIDFVSRRTLNGILSPKFYDDYEEFQDVLYHHPEIYNEDAEFLNSPPKDLEVYQIAPDEDLKTTTIKHSQESIEHDYRYGLEKGLDFIMSNS